MVWSTAGRSSWCTARVLVPPRTDRRGQGREWDVDEREWRAGGIERENRFEISAGLADGCYVPDPTGYRELC
jgi:hypothetical protein